MNKKLKTLCMASLSFSLIAGSITPFMPFSESLLVANAAARSPYVVGSDGLEYQVDLKDSGMAELDRDRGGVIKRISLGLETGETPSSITSSTFKGNDLEVVYTTSKGKTKTVTFTDVLNIPDVIPDFSYDSAWIQTGVGTASFPSFSVKREYFYESKVGSFGKWIRLPDRALAVKENGTHSIRAVDPDGKVYAERSFTINGLVFPSDMNVTTPDGVYTVAFNNNNTKTGVVVKNKSGANIYNETISKSGYFVVNMTGYTWSGNDLMVSIRYQINGGSSQVVETIRLYDILRISTPPAVPNMQPSTTALTNENVRVNISYTSDSAIKEYKVGENGAWTSYTAPIEVSENTKVYARAKNSRSVVSEEAVLNIANIDKLKPTAPTVKVDKDQLLITPGTDASGIGATYYTLNQGNALEYTGAVTLPEGQYAITSYSVDKAGNTSDLTTLDVRVTSGVDLTNATEAVVRAENAPSQSLVDAAQVEIDKLPDSPEKTELQNRLDQVKANVNAYASVQSQIDQMNAVLNQGNVTFMMVEQHTAKITELRNVVSNLPNTMNKAHLSNQLDELIKKLKLIEVLLKKGEGDVTEVDLDDLQDQIDKLPDGDLKDNLQDQLDEAKAVQDAIKKVEQAETSKDQKDVDEARAVVDKLPDGQVKDELNDRLDNVQKEIDAAKQLADQIADATKKVEQAEASKDQKDIDVARDAVNKLPEGQVKKDLNDRLDAIQKQIDDKKQQEQNQDAIDKVEKAEETKSQADVDKARDAVDKLPDGPLKDELTDRLDDVQKEIDEANANPIEKAVKKAEGSKAQVDVDAARDLVNTLPDGSESSAYHTRLDVVDAALKAASTKTRQAELYKRNPYISDATDLVNALKKSPAQVELKNRLDAIRKGVEDKEFQDLLDRATRKVKQAEQYKRNPYITDAWDLVNQLRDGQDKQALVDRLKALEKQTQPTPVDPDASIEDQIGAIPDEVVKAQFMNFLNALKNAEKYKTRTLILNALDKEALISETSRQTYSSIFAPLSTRLQTLKNAYNAGLENPSEEVQNATKYVEYFEKYKTAYYKKKAQEYVSALQDGPSKDELQARIDAVQK
ncbi:OmpL47-type beta-barrel domain-containing protein [Paenibacillus massiliensis]|uniref:OmpL47-type beta-barrel domain-containing protein n=1 Tax=Paenibacillus massiliensis TaxID=225917 RepID=UPI0004B45768|nr:protease epr [Paenibacillus massiliensis]